MESGRAGARQIKKKKKAGKFFESVHPEPVEGGEWE
jgi:hypothetical protein